MYCICNHSYEHPILKVIKRQNKLCTYFCDAPIQNGLEDLYGSQYGTKATKKLLFASLIKVMAWVYYQGFYCLQNL